MKIILTLNSYLLFFAILFFGTPAFAQQGSEVENSQTAEQLFNPNKLVEIVIDVPKPDWDTIRAQSRSFVSSLGKSFKPSPFTYVKGNVSIDGVLIEDVGIRKKGFLGSLDETRPSLKIKFAEYKDQNPIEGLDRLTLNNNKQDPAALSQFLAYKLFNESGTRSPRCNFAKVTVNGKYLGIYSNVESVKSPFLERAFGDSSGGLFEGTVVDFYADWVPKFEKKNQQADYKQLEKIAKLLESEQVDLQQLEKLIDIEAFIRFWAMESLTGFWDGYCNNQNNYFIYQDPANSKWYFIPWGTDSAFVKTMPLPPYRVRPRSVHSQSILANKLYRIPETQQLYKKTLMEFLDTHWNENELLAELDRIEALLKDHVHGDERGFKRGMRNYRRFVETRRKEIMEEFEDGMPELKSRERAPIYFGEIGTAKVTFETQWFDKTPRQTNGLGQVELELELNGKSVEMVELGAYAERSKWPSPEPVKPPSIVITGKRKSDGKQLTFGTGLSSELFKPTAGEPVEIGGIFMVGQSFMTPDGRMRMIGGLATFEQTSMSKGDPVKGTMELTIVEMKGGQPADN